jgi:hypothetical protein
MTSSKCHHDTSRPKHTLHLHPAEAGGSAFPEVPSPRSTRWPTLKASKSAARQIRWRCLCEARVERGANGPADNRRHRPEHMSPNRACHGCRRNGLLLMLFLVNVAVCYNNSSAWSSDFFNIKVTVKGCADNSRMSGGSERLGPCFVGIGRKGKGIASGLLSFGGHRDTCCVESLKCLRPEDCGFSTLS